MVEQSDADHPPRQSPPRDDAVELAPGVRTSPDALRFAFSRSSGPGGQNVNKRSTKVELRISLADLSLEGPVRQRLIKLAGFRLIGVKGDEPELLIVSDEHRTQAGNRRSCLSRLRALLIEASSIPKPRKKTRPTRGSVERRLDAKRQQSQKKGRRQPPQE